MTAFIIGILIGVLVGFIAALVLNHAEPTKFDDLTDKAERKVQELKK